MSRIFCGEWEAGKKVTEIRDAEDVKIIQPLSMIMQECYLWCISSLIVKSQEMDGARPSFIGRLLHSLRAQAQSPFPHHIPLFLVVIIALGNFSPAVGRKSSSTKAPSKCTRPTTPVQHTQAHPPPRQWGSHIHPTEPHKGKGCNSLQTAKRDPQN